MIVLSRWRVVNRVACAATENLAIDDALRVHDAPVLDVTAIDNLPSMLPRESSEDFATQLLPHLKQLDQLNAGVWGRARDFFVQAVG